MFLVNVGLLPRYAFVIVLPLSRPLSEYGRLSSIVALFNLFLVGLSHNLPNPELTMLVSVACITQIIFIRSFPYHNRKM